MISAVGYIKKRVLSIQSHVVHGYVGNKSATFPLQASITLEGLIDDSLFLSLMSSFLDLMWMPSIPYSFQIILATM